MLSAVDKLEELVPYESSYTTTKDLTKIAKMKIVGKLNERVVSLYLAELFNANRIQKRRPKWKEVMVGRYHDRHVWMLYYRARA